MIAPHLGDSAAFRGGSAAFRGGSAAFHGGSAAFRGGSAAFRAESLRLSGVPDYYLEALPRRRSRLDIIEHDRKGGAFPHGLRQSRCKKAIYFDANPKHPPARSLKRCYICSRQAKQ